MAPSKRSWHGVRPRHGRGRPTVWTVLVPVVALIAGGVFAISARTADGTDLRTDRVALTELIRTKVSTLAAQEQVLEKLQSRIAGLQQNAAQYDTSVAAAAQQAAPLEAPAGMTEVSGPAVRVSLDDAPLGPDGQPPLNARPDDVVIHQSDVQGVVNAMWLAGAKAIMIMGKRLITTSAVRCVGNTLLLDGKTYSPPFVITAVGDQNAIEKSLSTAPGTQLFLQAVTAFGLGYVLTRQDSVTVPAYGGSLGVSVATPIR